MTHFLAIFLPFYFIYLGYFELALFCVRYKQPFLHALFAVGAVILVGGVAWSFVFPSPLSLVPIALLSGGAVVAAKAQDRRVFAIAFTAAVVMVFPFYFNWISVAYHGWDALWAFSVPAASFALLAGAAMLAARAPHPWQRVVLAIVLTAAAVAFFPFAASTMFSQLSH